MGVTLQSPYSVRECEERLAAKVGSFWSFSRDLPVFGDVGAGYASLRKRIWYRNSFQTILRVRLISVADGTLLHCNAGVSVFVVVFLIIWFSLVLPIGCTMTLTGITLTPLDGGEAIFTLLLLGGGLAIWAFGRFLARDEEAYLTEYVCSAVDAHAVGPRP